MSSKHNTSRWLDLMSALRLLQCITNTQASNLSRSVLRNPLKASLQPQTLERCLVEKPAEDCKRPWRFKKKRNKGHEVKKAGIYLGFAASFVMCNIPCIGIDSFLVNNL